jgi:hypothetical protein
VRVHASGDLIPVGWSGPGSILSSFTATATKTAPFFLTAPLAGTRQFYMLEISRP